MFGASSALAVRNLFAGDPRGHGPVPVWDVSFDVTTGSIAALVGGRDSGSATVVDVLAGRLPARSGRLSLHGVDLSSAPPGPSNSAGITVTGADVPVVPYLTVGENLALVPGARPSIDSGRVTRVLDRLRATHLTGRYPSELAVEELLQVAIAFAAMHNPALIVLDVHDAPDIDAEPVLRSARELIELDGRTVIVHAVRLPGGQVDQRLVMEGGHLVRAGPEVLPDTPPQTLA